MAEDEARAARIVGLKEQHPQLTWAKIAAQVGVSERATHRWRATGAIKPDNAESLARIFGVDFDYLWTGPRPETPDLFVDRRQNGSIDDGGDRLARMEKRLIGHAEHIEALLEKQDGVLAEIKAEQAALRDLITEQRELKAETDDVHHQIEQILGTLLPQESASAPPRGPQRSGRGKKKPAASPSTP